MLDYISSTELAQIINDYQSKLVIQNSQNDLFALFATQNAQLNAHSIDNSIGRC